MNDIPNNNYAVIELIKNHDDKFDNDVVVLDLTTLYQFRPTYTKLPTSLGILIPNDLSDMFDTVFIRSLVEAIIEQGIHITNIGSMLAYVESEINQSLSTSYIFKTHGVDICEYVISFYNALKDMIDRHTEGYVNVGIIDNYDTINNIDKFYTISDINIYINYDKAHMQLLIRIWTRSLLWKSNI
jgi:hypothetical protein